MIEEVQSHLVTAIAGAVIASALLAAASFERALGDDLALQKALDEAAAAIAHAGCGAARPFARIDLGALLAGVDGRSTSVLLLPDHLRALKVGGGALESLRFPDLPLTAPLELQGSAALELRFDPIDERCAVARL